MSNDLVVKLAKDLVSIRSDTPNNFEGNVGEYIFNYLKDIGIKSEKQIFDKEKNRFNVIVCESQNASLLVNGHMDTVPAGQGWKYNQFGEIVDGKVYGRGSSDTKGNIACVLAAMKEHFNENIAYVFNVEEENSLEGIKKVMELRESRFKNVKYSISLEPTNGKIMIGNKGQYTLEVIAEGKAAHASVPEKGENAIYRLAKIVGKLEKYNKELSKRKYDLFGKASTNVGIIQGGNAVNSVPDFARIEVDRRVLPNENPKEVEKEFRALTAPFKTNFIKRTEACETEKNAKIVKEMQAILQKLNMDPALEGFRATSECSEISLRGIQGIIFGTGELSQAHVANEYITLKELEQGRKVFSELFRKWKD
ncbi:MAG: M20 family metallopeptidase [archaeon]